MWTSSEEDKDVKIGQKDGHNFLGCMRYNSYRLLSIKVNDQWRLLRSLIGLFQQHFKEKTFPFGYELLLHPAYSPDLAPCDYFLFPNLKKWFGGKRFITQRAAHRQNRNLFWKVGQIIRTAWKSWRIEKEH